MARLKFLFKGEVVGGIPQAFLSGVPARDLTEADWALLDEAQREQVAESALYEAVSKPVKEKDKE